MKIRAITFILALCFICLTVASCNESDGKSGRTDVSGSDGSTAPVTTKDLTVTEPATTQPVNTEKQSDGDAEATGTIIQSISSAQPTSPQIGFGSYYLIDPEKEYPRYVVDEVLLETDWFGNTATLFKGRYVNETSPGTLAEDKIGAVYYNGEVKESVQFNIASDANKDPSFTLLEGNVIYIRTDTDKAQSIDVFFPIKGADGTYRITYELLDSLSHYTGSKFYFAEKDGQGLYQDYILFDTDGNYRSLPWLTESPATDDPTKKDIDPALLITEYIPGFSIPDDVDPNNYYWIHEITLVNNYAKLVNGNLVYADAISVSTSYFDKEKNTTIILKRSYDLEETTYTVDDSYYEIES